MCIYVVTMKYICTHIYTHCSAVAQCIYMHTYAHCGAVVTMCICVCVCVWVWVCVCVCRIHDEAGKMMVMENEAETTLLVTMGWLRSVGSIKL